ncbi:MAG: SAM-dependent methyltransferase [Deltaproteobacteria bacterium]|nr:SAM-dependent methyltransferase [Deltaproteobacteria bacterium]
MGYDSRAGEGNRPARTDLPRLQTAPEKEILRRIGKGPITFAEFMETALYWGDGGYYASSREKWGGEGDYITSIDVSPSFARLLGKQVVEMWEALGTPGDFALIEAGAGRGWLSKGVLQYLKASAPKLAGSIRIRLVDKNPRPERPPEGRVTWHRDLAEIKGPLKGVVVSNELIDSFPVHVVEQRGGLKEVFVDFRDGSFKEVLLPPSTPALEGYFKDLGITLAEGQRAEVNLRAKDWIKKAGGLLSRGFVITIDYGFPAKELFSPERNGSLLCHFRHTLNDDPYINIGLQDITSHVDFTTLVNSGKEAGLELTGFTTQKNFLLGLGLEDELHSVEKIDIESFEMVARNRAIGMLIAPGGMGDTFKVLVQHKGVDKPALKGFSFKDMSRRLF